MLPSVGLRLNASKPEPSPDGTLLAYAKFPGVKFHLRAHTVTLRYVLRPVAGLVEEDPPSGLRVMITSGAPGGPPGLYETVLYERA